ncbi:hypothetical protein BDF22DRAFT_467218 [Syncephalis plumigaleata]|nr:hypothetical protein BDF22DRAFT_467218 [Syncephalis plumigaleata]
MKRAFELAGHEDKPTPSPRVKQPQILTQSLQCVRKWNGENPLLNTSRTQEWRTSNRTDRQECGRLYMQAIQTNFIEPSHINGGHIYLEATTSNSNSNSNNNSTTSPISNGSGSSSSNNNSKQRHLGNCTDIQGQSIPRPFSKEVSFNSELNISTWPDSHITLAVKHINDTNLFNGSRSERGLKSFLVNSKRSLGNLFHSRRGGNTPASYMNSSKRNALIKSSSCSEDDVHTSYSGDVGNSSMSPTISYSLARSQLPLASTSRQRSPGKVVAICHISTSQLIPLQLTEYRWIFRIPDSSLKAKDYTPPTHANNENGMMIDGRICGTIFLKGIYIPHDCHIPIYQWPDSFGACCRVVAEQYWHRKVQAEGVLQQRGGGVAFWRRRHARLVGGILQLRDPVTMTPVIYISLNQLLDVAMPSTQDTTDWATTASYVFRLRFPDGYIEFGVSSLHERKHWIAKLTDIANGTVPPSHDWLEQALLQYAPVEAAIPNVNVQSSSLTGNVANTPNTSTVSYQEHNSNGSVTRYSQGSRVLKLAAKPSTLRRRPARRVYHHQQQHQQKNNDGMSLLQDKQQQQQQQQLQQRQQQQQQQLQQQRQQQATSVSLFTSSSSSLVVAEHLGPDDVEAC